MRFHRLSILLFIISFVFFSFGNGMLPVTDPVESNYALTAKEMVQSGDWLSPQIYHVYWFDKPIMIYWLLALSYTIFGISDFAARLPSALFGALTVVLMYQEMRTISNRRLLSIWGASILGTSLMFWVMAHGIVTDMVLVFFTLGTMAYAYRGIFEQQPWLVTLAYIFAGLAVLTKGPVGVVLPGLILIAYAIYMRSFDIFKRLFPWQGILLFVVIVMIWYYPMYQIHGQAFIDGFLGLNNVTRATVSEHPDQNVWWYYLAIFPLASLPWTGVIIYAMVKGRRVYNKYKKPFYPYLMFWSWGPILFYSLMATKYPTYTFITVLPLSVLGAIGIVLLLHPNKGVKEKRFWCILTVPAVFLWVVYFIASFFVKWGFWYLLYVFVITGISAIIILQKKGKRYLLPPVIAIVTICISGVIIYEGLQPLVVKRSAAPLTPVIERFNGDIYNFGGYKTSLVYYSGKDITLIYGSNMRHKDSDWAGKYQMPKVEPLTVREQIVSGEKALIIVPPNELETFQRSNLFNLVNFVGKVREDAIFVTPNDAATVKIRQEGPADALWEN